MSSKRDLITSILAKAERTSNPEEAEAYTAKATALMIKYGIEAASLAADKRDAHQVADEEIVKVTLHFTGSYCKADLYGAFYLADAVTKGQYAYRTRNHLKDNDETLHVAAFESDAFVITTLAASLRLQAHTAMRQWWKTERHQYAAFRESVKFNARRNFLWAFHKEAARRVKEARTTIEREAGAKAEVALVDRAALVRDHKREAGLLLGKTRGARLGANAAGTAAGGRADIGQRSFGGRGRAIGA